MTRQIRPALVMFVLLSVMTGAAYPALVTVVAKVFFPARAAGSVVVRDGTPVGSALIGQSFSDVRYFWPRPSATTPVPYNAAAGSGSNLAPSNPALTKAVTERVAALRAAHPGGGDVPVDLVTASGSGLDPHISPAAAEYQVQRVARERGMTTDAVRALVRDATDGPSMGVLGEPRVNVLKLNLALDQPAKR